MLSKWCQASNGLARISCRLVKTTGRQAQHLYSTESTSTATSTEKGAKMETKSVVPHEFRHVFPDFLPEPYFDRRHPVAEKLIRADMLKRRMNIDIPEFYVGSIMAVTCSDPYAPKRVNRFVGICIQRDMRGLWHQFLLRNVIDGFAVEVPYDMYNPLIQSVQVLRLEKRPDEHLLYLRDALLEYSTFPLDMQPEPLAPGAPVPVNLTKVKLKLPPWTKRWQYYGMYGIDDIYDQMHEWFKKRFHRSRHADQFEKYDIVAHYRRDTPMQDQQKIYEQILDFEEQNQANERKFAGRKITTVSAYFKRTRQHPTQKGNADSKSTWK